MKMSEVIKNYAVYYEAPPLCTYSELSDRVWWQYTKKVAINALSHTEAAWRVYFAHAVHNLTEFEMAMYEIEVD